MILSRHSSATTKRYIELLLTLLVRNNRRYRSLLDCRPNRKRFIEALHKGKLEGIQVSKLNGRDCNIIYWKRIAVVDPAIVLPTTWPYACPKKHNAVSLGYCALVAVYQLPASIANSLPTKLTCFR